MAVSSNKIPFGSLTNAVGNVPELVYAADQTLRFNGHPVEVIWISNTVAPASNQSFGTGFKPVLDGLVYDVTNSLVKDWLVTPDPSDPSLALVNGELEIDTEYLLMVRGVK